MFFGKKTDLVCYQSCVHFIIEFNVANMPSSALKNYSSDQAESTKISLEEAWEVELLRLRKVYTERGALLAVMLFPVIMLADYLYKMSENGYLEWFVVRLSPSLVILTVFLLLRNTNTKWKYDILLFVAVGSLFTSVAYKISPQQMWTSFLSANIILVIAMSALIVARGFLVYLLFAYLFLINLFLNLYQHQDETFVQFMSNYGVSLLGLGAIFIFVAEARYNILKRNFSNAFALQSYLEILEEQKCEIERKNEDITASISYAQRIQANILPQEEEINASFEDYFILFKPRDIISGDFYWFATLQPSKHTFEKVSSLEGLGQALAPPEHEKIIWIVADCTGHGVPGALMSMLGHELLNEIVFHEHITAPDQILKHLHEGIYKTLKQKDNQSQDGMDISILVIDKEAQEIQFAAARHTLVYTKNGEYCEIKGDKYAIGGDLRTKEKHFTCHTLPLEKGTEYVFYMFSDGYQDQFGGKQNKKFMSKHFKQLLHKIHQQPLPQQRAYLNETLEDWKAAAQQSQTDDILVIGVKVNSLESD